MTVSSTDPDCHVTFEGSGLSGKRLAAMKNMSGSGFPCTTSGSEPPSTL